MSRQVRPDVGGRHAPRVKRRKRRHVQVPLADEAVLRRESLERRDAEKWAYKWLPAEMRVAIARALDEIERGVAGPEAEDRRDLPEFEKGGENSETG